MLASCKNEVGSPKTYGDSFAVNLWKERAMKYLKTFLIALVMLGMSSWSISIATEASGRGMPEAMQEATQNQATALERGYRTGYSDGYNAGYRDIADRATRDYQNKDEYRRGDRSYNEAWGTVEDYRDGYQQGFEVGYAAGYDRRLFDSTIPSGLTKRDAVESQPSSNNNASNTTSPDNTSGESQTNASGPAGSGPLSIPRDAILVVELQSSLSTDASQQGDRFQARVVEPSEFEGAIVEGRVTRVKRPGKVKGTAELQLSFESIRTVDNRASSISANVVEVVDMGSRDGAGTVDSEGGVRGRSSTKDDVSKVGAATGIGAIIGAIIGGGKGAAIGAAVGGSAGTAGVLTQRGKDVRLERGQRLKIRTATEARIQ